MSKSLIGLKNVVFAELTADTATIGTVTGETTYGSVEVLAGAIDAQITPDTTDANIQYADDVEYDALAPDTSYTIEAEIAGLTIAQMAKLQGHKLSSDGGVIIKDGDNPPYIAFGFKSAKSGGGFRYVWIYKAKPEFMAQGYHTKEGPSVTRQTVKIKLKGIARISDGLKQYITDKESENFFDAPATPSPAA